MLWNLGLIERFKVQGWGVLDFGSFAPVAFRVTLNPRLEGFGFRDHTTPFVRFACLRGV